MRIEGERERIIREGGRKRDRHRQTDKESEKGEK